MKYLRAVFFFTSVIVLTVLCATAVFILFPFVYFFDKQRHSLHAIGILWAWLIKIFNPWWHFNIKGKHNLPKNNHAVVYVANHQSQMDILALFMVNMRFRWIAKASLFKIPFLGWAMSAVGYVPVVRGNIRSQEQCMLRSAEFIKNGVSMGFFPEGTRSESGELGVFKTGAFRLAQSTGAPIVPISIQGCGKLLPKHSLIPQKADVMITVHPAISSTDYDLKTLIEKTREAILSGM